MSTVWYRVLPVEWPHAQCPKFLKWIIDPWELGVILKEECGYCIRAAVKERRCEGYGAVEGTVCRVCGEWDVVATIQ